MFSLTSGVSTSAVTTFPLVFKHLPVPPVLQVCVHVPAVGVAEHAGALRPPKVLPVSKSMALVLSTVPEEVTQPRTFFSIANLDEIIENLAIKLPNLFSFYNRTPSERGVSSILVVAGKPVSQDRGGLEAVEVPPALPGVSSPGEKIPVTVANSVPSSIHLVRCIDLDGCA